MEVKSKVISGLKRGNCFTISERHQIIQEMISSGCTKRDIWEKYTGRPEEHGQLLRWMRELGYNDDLPMRRLNFVENNRVMVKKKTIVVTPDDSLVMVKKKTIVVTPDDSFENLQLKKRISELEFQLKDSEMKAIAFSTMIDIAEKQFNIPIRKKVNTKPLKK